MTEGATGHEDSEPRADEAPAMLRHAVDAGPRIEPIRSDAAVAAMHQTWAQMAEGNARASGTRGRMAKLVGGSSAGHGDDRALIGDVIRAADALAARCDELAERIVALEGALAEMIEVFGADLTRLRAAAAARGDETRPPTG